MKMRLIALLFLFTAGCQKELTPGWLIGTPRVLGARVEIPDDPTRASPRPGEAFTVRWHMAFAETDEPVSWALLACDLGESHTGTQICGNEPLGLAIQTEGITGAAPTLDLVAPDEVVPLLVAGVICVNGTPTLNSATLSASCEGEGATETVVSYVVTMSDSRETDNHQPTFEGGAITLNDTGWDEQVENVFVENCATEEDPAWPVITRGDGTQEIKVSFDDAQRETYEVMRGDPPQPTQVRESWQLSSFATSFDLERQYSYVEGDEAPVDRITLDWKPPKNEDIPAGGRFVRFYFVLRDGRGGEAWTTRALCVKNDNGSDS